MLKRTKKKYG